MLAAIRYTHTSTLYLSSERSTTRLLQILLKLRASLVMRIIFTIQQKKKGSNKLENHHIVLDLSFVTTQVPKASRADNEIS
jgi:hypothetical protein